MEQTYGQKAVGLKFNPSGEDKVDKIKAAAAALIDELHLQMESTEDATEKAYYSLAISNVMQGQMWGVKAATWSLPQKK